MPTSMIRDLVVRLLEWSHAHVNFETAVAGVPPELRGVRPDGYPHSLWELVEHVRITQADLLSFCLPDAYEELAWPSDYWPASPGPPEPEQWDESISRAIADRQALQAIASDLSLDLTEVVPHGSDQTYLRELLLAADHTAYHVGQIVAVRRMLGVWRE